MNVLTLSNFLQFSDKMIRFRARYVLVARNVLCIISKKFTLFFSACLLVASIKMSIFEISAAPSSRNIRVALSDTRSSFLQLFPLVFVTPTKSVKFLFSVFFSVSRSNNAKLGWQRISPSPRENETLQVLFFLVLRHEKFLSKFYHLN